MTLKVLKKQLWRIFSHLIVSQSHLMGLTIKWKNIFQRCFIRTFNVISTFYLLTLNKLLHVGYLMLYWKFEKYIVQKDGRFCQENIVFISIKFVFNCKKIQCLIYVPLFLPLKRQALTYFHSLAYHLPSVQLLVKSQKKIFWNNVKSGKKTTVKDIFSALRAWRFRVIIFHDENI